MTQALQSYLGYSYPSQLAELVKKIWPKDRLAQLPQEHHLRQLFDIAYHASMLRDEDREGNSEDGGRTASSVRDIASRIPESLSAIGRDISRTIERAIAAKDDYVVAVKVSPEAQEKLEAQQNITTSVISTGCSTY